MEDAMTAGHVNRNPAAGAKLPKSEQKEMKFLSEDQVSQLLLAAQGDRYEALYHLAIATGLRQSEILGLQWSDLDLNRGILKVERQLKRSFKENDYFAQTKTKNGRRVLKFGAATIEKLQENRVTQNLDKAIAGARWKENNLVFPSSIGTPLNQRNLFNRFLALLDKAGLPRIRFHDLRHTSSILTAKSQHTDDCSVTSTRTL
jgi:integrase